MNPLLGAHTFRLSPYDGQAWYFDLWRAKDGKYYWQAFHDVDCMDLPCGHRHGPFDSAEEAHTDATSFDI